MDEREQIETLLIEKYWRIHSRWIVDQGLRAGYTLKEIAYYITLWATDGFIINCWSVNTFGHPKGIIPDNDPS